MIRVAGLVAAMLLAGPAEALADVRFKGETSQGRRVLVVSQDDGVPKRVACATAAR